MLNSNNANKILLNFLKQICDLTLNTNKAHYLKNSYLLMESLIKIKNVNNTATYDVTDLFKDINLNDLIVL